MVEKTVYFTFVDNRLKVDYFSTEYSYRNNEFISELFSYATLFFSRETTPALSRQSGVKTINPTLQVTYGKHVK